MFFPLYKQENQFAARLQFITRSPKTDILFLSCYATKNTRTKQNSYKGFTFYTQENQLAARL